MAAPIFLHNGVDFVLCSEKSVNVQSDQVIEDLSTLLSTIKHLGAQLVKGHPGKGLYIGEAEPSHSNGETIWGWPQIRLFENPKPRDISVVGVDQAANFVFFTDPTDKIRRVYEMRAVDFFLQERLS